MSSILGMLKSRTPYLFFVVAIVWLVFSVYVGSFLVLWPAFALAVGGALLWKWPSGRTTWAWANSACILGLLLSAYIAYAAVPLTGGAFSTTAALTIGAFVVFAIVHAGVMLMGIPGGKVSRSN